MKLKGLATALLGLVVLLPPAFSHQVFAQVQALSDLPFLKKLALARAGDSAAKFAVGEAYEEGLGARVNIAEAAKWYRQAALAGVLDAQYRLALIVEKGAKGVKPDQNAALKLLQAAANKGHAQSQWAFGQHLHQGQGLPKDDKLAALWVHKAAEQGLAVAQNDYATMLLHGWGVERNLDGAFKWFSKGADQGDLWAMNNLGGMYELGWGTPQDKAKAIEQYQNAAAKGNEGARRNLERLGLPVPAPATP